MKLKIAKYDETGRCIEAGRSFKRIQSALEILMITIMGVGTAALVAQAFGILIGAVDPM